MADQFYDKFPDEVIEFDADASSFLINGDTITSVSATVLDGGISALGARFSGSTVYFTVSGGNAGSIAHLSVKVNLVSLQLREALISVLIKPLPGAS